MSLSETYLEIVYQHEAEEQLEALIDAEPRYRVEPEAYEWLISRNPEGVGTPIIIPEDEPIVTHVFLTVDRKAFPRLAISYQVQREQQRVLILDVRQFV